MPRGQPAPAMCPPYQPSPRCPVPDLRRGLTDRRHEQIAVFLCILLKCAGAQPRCPRMCANSSQSASPDWGGLWGRGMQSFAAPCMKPCVQTTQDHVRHRTLAGLANSQKGIRKRSRGRCSCSRQGRAGAHKRLHLLGHPAPARPPCSAALRCRTSALFGQAG